MKNVLLFIGLSLFAVGYVDEGLFKDFEGVLGPDNISREELFSNS